MARLTSLLDLDQDDLQTILLASYGWNLSRLALAPARSRALFFFDSDRPDLYVAAHVAAAAAGVQLLDVPERRWAAADGFATGLVDGVVTAGDVALPADLRALPHLALQQPESAPVDVLAHLTPWYARSAGRTRATVAVGDDAPYCWAVACADLPLDVVHSGARRVDRTFLRQLAAEGQAGSFREGAAPADVDIDARTAPDSRLLAAAIAACLEWVLA